MRFHVLLVISLLGVLTWTLFLSPPLAADTQAPAAKETGKATYSQQIVPILAKYCMSCHSGAKPKGGLALDRYQDEASVLKDPRTWNKVYQNLRSGEMPPLSKPQPSAVERESVTDWIGVNVFARDGKTDPGRVTLRRLNRAEYNNTIRDLVGVTFQPAEDFPVDDVGYGFDNIGDVLSLPPLLLEKYLAAAEKIVARSWETPETRQRIMICEPNGFGRSRRECARKIVESFARRAYRRPVTADEVDRLVSLARSAEEQGARFQEGMQLALCAILVSPHFLFRVEVDPEPSNAKAVHTISDHELAVRLSYFLWSSMPDDKLFALADQGALRKDGNLEAQVWRMLADPKASALAENFAGQWLQTRNLKTATPDPDRFPNFDESLRTAMSRESELFFEAIVKEDRSVLDFLESDFTFVNGRLARHYGMPGIRGGFRKVPLSGEQRGGILSQASVLTVTSNPTRTSPVKRGKWILENILGTPPPPPPPDAGELSEDAAVVQSGSLRQRLEMHRANPNCAVCHQRMDPLGFGLENFDAIGAWRTKDGEFTIDPSGALPDGKSFQGPRELKAILLGQKDAFCRCLADKLLTYALGRGLEYYDRPALDRICGALAENEYKFSSLVTEIVKSEPFQKRRGYRGEP